MRFAPIVACRKAFADCSAPVSLQKNPLLRAKLYALGCLGKMGVRVIPLFSSFVSLASLLCAVTCLATSHWIDFARSHPILNPIVTNDKLQKLRQTSDSTTVISYPVSHYGLWVGCFRVTEGPMSCAFIGGRCNANVCWIRESLVSKATTCMKSRVSPLSSCIAFQAVRVLLCMGVLLAIVASSLILVSFCTRSRTLSAVGGLTSFAAGVLLMICFSVFYSEEFVKNRVAMIASIGYSLMLLILAWVGSLLAGLFSCCAASAGARSKEISEYSASVL